MRWVSAYSRHGSFTGQVAQILRARSTPTPSLGKKAEGGWSRQLPWAIHTVALSSNSTGPPARVVSDMDGAPPALVPCRRQLYGRGSGEPTLDRLPGPAGRWPPGRREGVPS